MNISFKTTHFGYTIWIHILGTQFGYTFWLHNRGIRGHRVTEKKHEYVSLLWFPFLESFF